MLPEPGSDKSLVGVIDERASPFAHPRIRLLNRLEKIFSFVCADQFGKRLVKHPSEQRRRSRSSTGALLATCRFIDLSAYIADLQSNCHKRSPPALSSETFHYQTEQHCWRLTQNTDAVGMLLDTTFDFAFLFAEIG